MKRDEAFKLLRERVDEAIPRFKSYPLYIHVEEFTSDTRLNPVKPEKATYICVTIVFKTDINDDEDSVEHRIGIGAEVKYGEVKESMLEESIKDFEERIDAMLVALGESEDTVGVVRELDRLAGIEYENLADEIDRRARKVRPFYILGCIAFTAIVIFLFILASGG